MHIYSYRLLPGTQTLINTFLQDVATMALLFKEKLTELHHLGSAALGNGEQQLLVLPIRGGLAANSVRFDLQDEILGVKCRCDTLRTDSVVQLPKDVF